MANEKHIDQAVVKLAAYLDSNLPAKLRAVESAQSLSTNALTDPVDVLAHRAPFDNRSPLVEVFDEGWTFEQQRMNLLAVDCTVSISFVSDANLAGAEQFMRHQRRHDTRKHRYNLHTSRWIKRSRSRRQLHNTIRIYTRR